MVTGNKKTREPTLTIDSLLGGGYLLSHFRSTIGVVGLNFSVRNGKRWDPHAITTLSFAFFSPYGALACGAAVMPQKKPSGERYARKPSSRFFWPGVIAHTGLPYGIARARPHAFSSSAIHTLPSIGSATRARKAFG